MADSKTSDKEQKPPLPIEVILGAFAVDALQENFDYLKRWASDVKIETYNGVPIVRLGFDLSARGAITPEQFNAILPKIVSRMEGHTIARSLLPAWQGFMALLRVVTPYECGIGPMPREGNSPYVGEKK